MLFCRVELRRPKVAAHGKIQGIIVHLGAQTGHVLVRKPTLSEFFPFVLLEEAQGIGINAGHVRQIRLSIHPVIEYNVDAGDCELYHLSCCQMCRIQNCSCTDAQMCENMTHICVIDQQTYVRLWRSPRESCLSLWRPQLRVHTNM